MKFYMIVASAVLILTNPIWAQSPISGISGNQEYVKNVERLIKDNPGKSLQEIERMVTNLRTNQTSGLVPEANLTKGSRILELSPDLKEIHVLILDKDDITVVVSPDNKVRANIEVISSGNAGNVNDLLGSTGMVNQSGVATLTSNANSYWCIRYRLNGALSAQGTCFNKVQIALPANSPIIVRDNKTRLNHLNQPMSKQEFFDINESALSSDRPTLLTKFLTSNPSVKLSVTETTQIEDSLFSSDLAKALVLIAPHLPSLTASDVDAILDKPFESDRLVILRSLIPKVRTNERANLIPVIEDKLFSSDREEAMKMLVIGR